jgi:hypothetical protein
VTQEGQTKGKAGYMSPEQCSGDRIDRRSDIFALGILLYEATTGVRAFYAPNDFAIMGRTARVDYIPPQQIDPEYPPALARILARAMAKEPDDRYPTAEAMQLELEELAHAEDLRLSTVELARHMKQLFGSPAHPHTDLGALPSPTPALAPTPAVVPAPAPAPARLPWVLAGAGLATAVALAIALWPRPDSIASEPAAQVRVDPGQAARGESPAASASVVVPPAEVTPSAAAEPEPLLASPPPEVEVEVEPAVSPEPDPIAEPPREARVSQRSKKRRRAKADAPQTDRNTLYPPGMRP